MKKPWILFAVGVASAAALLSVPFIARPVNASIAVPVAHLRGWLPLDGAVGDRLGAALVVATLVGLATLLGLAVARLRSVRSSSVVLVGSAGAAALILAAGGWPRASGAVARALVDDVPGHHDFHESAALRPLLEGDHDVAMWRLEHASAAGDASSAYLLGTAYLHGYGVDRDSSRAVDLLERAVEGGSGPAAYTLADVLQRGDGVARDERRAHQLLQLSVERPHVSQDAARARLGLQLQHGRGVERDTAAARTLFEEAAPGSAEASYALASLLEQERRMREAFDLYFQAGLVGHAGAQHALARLYETGVGVASSTELAHEWRGRAAQQGWAPAQIEHGRRLLAGASSSEQASRAIGWIELAAEQGNSDAMLAAGRILLGIGQRRVAFYYLNLAASQGSTDAAQLRDRLRSQLSPAELRDAERRSADWSPAKPLEAYRLTSSGTGFFVGIDHTFVTNEHVVSECARVAIARKQGDELWPDVEIIAADAEVDVAILRVRVPEGASLTHGVAPLRAARPEAGQPVVVFGFPLANILSVSGSVTTGVISSIAGIQDDRRVVQMTAPIQPGNSGSAIFDDAGGVIGVARSSLTRAQNVNFGAKIQVVANMLAQHGLGYFLTRRDAASLPPRLLAQRAEAASARVLCYAHR